MSFPAKSLRVVAAFLALPFFFGCGNFFVTPSTSSSTTSSNLVYLVNATAQTIAAYQVGTGSLTAVTGSPFSLGYVPQAAIVSRANTFLYISAATSSGSATSSAAVYGYSIASDGALTSLGALAAYDLLTLDVSPDGKWLVGLDALTQSLDIFSVDTSTGALSLAGQPVYATKSGTITPRMARFAPSGTYVFAALGSAGDAVFTFDSDTGSATQSQILSLGSLTTSDNAVAVNSTSTTLYVARSGGATDSTGVAVYTIGASGVLTPAAGSPFAAGSTPYALALDSTETYLYAANRGDGTISGYLVGTTTALTNLGSSPYVSGVFPTALSLDKSNTYLLAGANGANPDLTLYSFDTTTAGKLDTTSSVTSVANAGLVAIATTH